MIESLNDLKGGGFIHFSKTLRVSSVEEAERIADFIDEPFDEVFQSHGHGDYFIAINRGWDRCGDYNHVVMLKIKPEGLTFDQLVERINTLNAKVEYQHEPFVLMEQVRAGNKPIGTLTKDELEVMSRASAEKAVLAQRDLENFLEV